MPKIAPSLLSADFMNLAEEITKVQIAGADILHLDVMDGHFVPNLTFGMPIVRQIKNISSLPLDVHLMVENPQNYLEELVKLKVEYVSVHQEAVVHLHRQIAIIKSGNLKAGVALNPATPVETLYPILPDLDFVLIMSVNPGFGGQQFLPLVYEKIKTLRKRAERVNPALEIEVDGGVNDENAPRLVSAGVDILVAGSYIFKSEDYSLQIKKLRK
ncbi:MAG: ribulose-phosphate 3-epimerase [Candidatus Cloacimonas sp. 4484_275]|nr:MAG: ribulose-phosphate 3-epimerase [Candidatus Cloacimonas sp. 4484_275]